VAIGNNKNVKPVYFRRSASAGFDDKVIVTQKKDLKWRAFTFTDVKDVDPTLIGDFTGKFLLFFPDFNKNLNLNHFLDSSNSTYRPFSSLYMLDVILKQRPDIKGKGLDNLEALYEYITGEVCPPLDSLMVKVKAMMAIFYNVEKGLKPKAVRTIKLY